MLIELAYEHPPDTLPLAAAEVHVWRFPLVQSAEVRRELLASLDSEERARAERFRFERDRNAYIVAHGTVRSILAKHLSARPEALVFEQGERGKPRLVDSVGKAGVRFNLSHSAELGLLAVAANAELGVDLERVRTLTYQDQIAAKFFSAGEQAELAEAAPEQRDWVFFTIWTRKEALAKADGGGLSLALEELDSTRCFSRDEACEASSKWTLFQFSPGPGYIAALVAAAPVGKVRSWEWGTK